MRAYSAMVFRGPAQSMPGEIWTLMQVAGKDRDFVFDSTFDAALHAAHFGVELAFDEPPYMDPRRALDYSNIEESMHIPVAGLFASNKVDGQRYASTLVTGPKFDALNENDKNVSFGGG